MQFNLSTLLVAAAAFAASARGAAIEERQAGAACFVGSITVLGIPITINSCGVTNPGDDCSNTGSPVTVSLDDIASLSLAIGVSILLYTLMGDISNPFCRRLVPLLPKYNLRETLKCDPKWFFWVYGS